MMDDVSSSSGNASTRGRGRGRGGRGRGRKRKQRAQGESVVLVSCLAQYLFEAWSLGSYSPQEAQRLAALASKDIEVAIGPGPSAIFHDLHRLSKIGSEGKHPGNMHNGMIRVMPNSPIPQPDMIDVTCRNKETGETDIAGEAVMWPHILFHALYNNMPKAFLLPHPT